MKDMSVDKLLQKLYDGYESKIHAELLRRFEELEKENQRMSMLLWGFKCAYCGEIVGSEFQNQDISEEILKAHVDKCPKHPMNNLKCCGNCAHKFPDYTGDYCELSTNDVSSREYCPQWQSDGLTREEREGI